MMFQGHQWTCGHCHHKNWLDLSELSAELFCTICKKPEDAPINLQWLFRPNQFVIESLRDHSVLSLVWTLVALRDRSRSSFFFVEPTWFYFDYDGKRPNAEADLLVVLDGGAMVCEVKASWAITRDERHSLTWSHWLSGCARTQRCWPSWTSEWGWNGRLRQPRLNCRPLELASSCLRLITAH